MSKKALLLVAILLLLTNAFSQSPLENQDSSLQIVEFGDFQSSYAARAELVLKQLKEAYPNKIEIVWKHFPLSSEGFSWSAAVAAECARNQGKFEEYKEKLFENIELQNEDYLKKVAVELGLDEASFNSCFDNKDTREIVESDRLEGISKGVSGVPTFFIDDRKIVGAKPFFEFTRIIDEELAKEPLTERQRPFLGKEDASVTLKVFMDFECSYCKRVFNSLQHWLAKDLADKVRVEFWHFPLTAIHSNSYSLAIASECAAEQGKFFEFVQSIFKNENGFDNDFLELLASQAGLDFQAFSNCFQTEKHRENVEFDVSEGGKLGVSALPTIFVNEKKIVGASDLYVLKSAIEAELKGIPVLDEFLDNPEPVFGNKNSPIIIEEFVDFQCPYCKKFNDETIKPLVERYPDKLQLVVRNFPLKEVYANAWKAAEASECALEQGSFWQMHDLLFEKQGEWAQGNHVVGLFKEYASRLNLNEKQFSECIDSGKYEEEVKSDRHFGVFKRVAGVPTVFVNGEKVEGAVPLRKLEVLLGFQEELLTPKPAFEEESLIKIEPHYFGANSSIYKEISSMFTVTNNSAKDFYIEKIISPEWVIVQEPAMKIIPPNGVLSIPFSVNAKKMFTGLTTGKIEIVSSTQTLEFPLEIVLEDSKLLPVQASQAEENTSEIVEEPPWLDSGEVSGQGDISITASGNYCCDAYYLPLHQGWLAYIDYSGDIDWWRFFPDAVTTYLVTLDVPAGHDFDLVIYGGCSGSVPTCSPYNYIRTCQAIGSESCTFEPNASQYYYIKVYGYAGDYDPFNQYRIEVTYTCTNECSLGDTRCVGNGYEICGDYDSDSCYEWGGGASCQYGCYTDGQGAYCPACTNDSQCGTDAYVGDPYCGGGISGDVYWDFQDYYCVNDAQRNSYCADSTTPILQDDCVSGEYCSDGVCWPCRQDGQTCSSPGNNTIECCSGSCNSTGQCGPDITCFSDADCPPDGWSNTPYCYPGEINGDVYDTYNDYSCQNPGQPSSYCWNDRQDMLRQDCVAGEYCSSGQCLNCRSDGQTCSTPGSSTIECCSGSCNSQGYCGEDPACFSDSDCPPDEWVGAPYCSNNDVYQTYRDYYCENPGQSNASCNFFDSEQLADDCSGTQQCVNGVCEDISCSATSDSAWVHQDNLCNDPIITKHKFANSGTEDIPYDIDFFLFDPSSSLISQASNSFTLEVGDNDTWTVTWGVPSGGWASGSYRAEAYLNGACAGGGQTSASNTAFPVIPSSCDSTTCSGTINVAVKDAELNPIASAQVFLDGSYYSDTDLQGQSTLNTSDSACGESHSVAIYCSDGTYCDTMSTTIHYDGDDDPLNFTCSVCAQTENLSVTASASSSYALNDTIYLDITVRDGSGALVDAADLAIYDPFQNYTAFRSTTNGTYTYSTVASSTGAHTFNITASKSNYDSASTTKSVSVSNQTGSIIVDVDDLEGSPLPNAKIYLDNVFQGNTGSNGRKTINTQTGSHSVQVYCQNNDFCSEQNINVTGNHSIYFDCGCQFSLRVNADNIQNVPLANVYIFVDNEAEEAGITNSFGYSLIEDIDYGNHNITVYFKLPEDEGGQIYYQTATVFVDSNPTVLEFELSPDNSVPYASISSTDENVSSQAIPAIVAVAVYAIVDTVSIALDIDELCSCMYQNSPTQNFGLAECANTIRTCLDNGMESQSCVDRVRNTNANLDNCPIEYGALAFDVGLGTGAGIATKAGKLAVVTGITSRGKKTLQILHDNIRVILRWGDNVADYIRNGLDWAGTWLDDTLRFRKVIKTPLGPISELASEGAEVVGKKASKEAQEKLIREGTEKVGKELMENGLEGLAKLEQRGVTGVDKLAKNIADASIAPSGVNVGQLKGALAHAEIAVRPEYIDDVVEVSKDITTGIGHTDIDILLATGKIIEAKNSRRLATMVRGSDEYSKFVNQIRKLLLYQTENSISAGVEVVSKQGFSADVLSFLQRMLDAGNNISWRVIS